MGELDMDFKSPNKWLQSQGSEKWTRRSGLDMLGNLANKGAKSTSGTRRVPGFAGSFGKEPKNKSMRTLPLVWGYTHRDSHELQSPCILHLPIAIFNEFLIKSKVLAAHGAAKVSAYVTHGIFPKSSWERFTHKNNGLEEAFAYFWITDSCPQTVKAIGNKAPFEVLNLAGSIADALQI
ncbi:unnamed protein product [Arabis nemorensis]|uniref:Ribose-phosphate pyrophosphokinase N-terminal domain-containing protein n=1 Tax=Arabis nemorensis TaxID=586526 RepID=A0A565BNL8_9BRAS|nr:unnamed protein product [Arabis nemorensis]